MGKNSWLFLSFFSGLTSKIINARYQAYECLENKSHWSKVWHHEALCNGAATQYKQQPTEQCNPSSSHSTVVINITKNLQRSMSLLLSSHGLLAKVVVSYLFVLILYFTFSFSENLAPKVKRTKSHRLSRKTCNSPCSYYLAPWPAC